MIVTYDLYDMISGGSSSVVTNTPILHITISMKWEKVINTYVFHKSFNDKQINRIKTLLSDDWNKAEVETGDSGRYKSDIRINEEQTLIPDKDGFPYTQISNVVAELNRDWWNFDVTGFNFLTDHPSAFKYNVGGKFDWHYDFTHSEPINYGYACTGKTCT